MSGPSPQLPRRPETIDQAIGERIRTYREQRKMTMAKLGAHVGVCFQQIAKYEHGTTRISASRLWEISEVLGVPIRLFFSTSGLISLEEADAEASMEPA